MKLRIKMEDFIADEKDKELARVAFRKAEKTVNRRVALGLFPVLAIFILSSFISKGVLSFSFFLGIGLLIVIIIVVCKWHEMFQKEYQQQLDELKLQMRGKE